nr:MAG TPA: hypothetical protein [Caudoviricetes sp.]
MIESKLYLSLPNVSLSSSEIGDILIVVVYDTELFLLAFLEYIFGLNEFMNSLFLRAILIRSLLLELYPAFKSGITYFSTQFLKVALPPIVPNLIGKSLEV